MAKAKKKKDNNISEEQFVKLQIESKKNFDGWQRALADYANLKRDNEKRQKDLVNIAQEKILLDILPILEMFNRALMSMPEEKKTDVWVQGMLHIKKQFDEVLSQFGVKTIDSVGQQFDHIRHEAIGEEETDEYAQGIVIKEASSGYEMNDKVIIPAKVIVAK